MLAPSMIHRVAAIAFAIAVAACGGDDKDKSVDHETPPSGGEPQDDTPTPEETPPDESPPDETPPDETPPDDEQAACETLDRAECLRATHCTMHFIENSRYECRASQGPCEVDLVQGDKPACEAREGCTWNPGSCYCPFPGYGRTQVEDKQKNAGGACACGGGPPPRCEPTDG